MRAASLGEREVEIVLLIGAAVVAYVAYKGVRGVATEIPKILYDAAGNVIVGVTDATGQAVGLPPLADITIDAGVARWIWDNPAGGWFAASKWSSAGALWDAGFMDEGSGTPPPPDSKIAKVFPGYSGVSGGW